MVVALGVTLDTWTGTALGVLDAEVDTVAEDCGAAVGTGLTGCCCIGLTACIGFCNEQNIKQNFKINAEFLCNDFPREQKNLPLTEII